MATQKQIDANRRNALQSTGPRTPEGKARARLNAVIHGLSGSLPSTLEEEAPLRALLREQLMDEWSPGSAVEGMLVDQIVETYLRLRRLPSVEAQMIADTRSRLADKQTSVVKIIADDLPSRWSKLERLGQYENRLSRQLHRLIHDLRLMQKDRAARDEKLNHEGHEEHEKGEEAKSERESEVAAATETGETNPIQSREGASDAAKLNRDIQPLAPSRSDNSNSGETNPISSPATSKPQSSTPQFLRQNEPLLKSRP